LIERLADRKIFDPGAGFDIGGLNSSHFGAWAMNGDVRQLANLIHTSAGL
jgi:hypothetical protein